MAVPMGKCTLRSATLRSTCPFALEAALGETATGAATSATVTSDRSAQQAATWASAFSSRAGGSTRHRSMTKAQRGANGQPDLRARGSGRPPSIERSVSVRGPSSRGMQASSPSVYGCRGWSKTRVVGPLSTISPAYMTAIRSARPATTLRSWLTISSDVLLTSVMRLSTSRIWAWMLTSRAVVGSSATTTFGSQESAIAIMTRCRIPPDSWCGYTVICRAGLGIPTEARSSTERARAWRRLMLRWTRSISSIWTPIVRTGLSDDIGS